MDLLLNMIMEAKSGISMGNYIERMVLLGNMPMDTKSGISMGNDTEPMVLLVNMPVDTKCGGLMGKGYIRIMRITYPSFKYQNHSNSQLSSMS